jgi:acetyl esterase/lipase
MVWFHGGGFVGGSGSSDVYGPDFLVAEDVVVVTLNYRLGPFGNFVRFVVCCHFYQSIRNWRHVLPSLLLQSAHQL